MSDNKLSTNLEKINVSVSDIRNTLDAQDVAIDDLSVMVSEVKTSLDELENNMVYQVSNHGEMYNLTNVVDGSTCLVSGTTIRGINETDTFNTIYYPDTVILPAEPIYDYSFSFNIANTGHGTIGGTLSGTCFDFMMVIKGLGSYGKNIDYDAVYNESQNAYIFTRQDTYGTPVISAGELSWDTNYTFDPVIGHFIQIEAPLQETYIYQNGNWVFVSADLASVVIGHEETIQRQNQEIETLNARIVELEQNAGNTELPHTPSTFEFRCIDSETGELLPSTGEYHVEVQLFDPASGVEYKRVNNSWHPFTDTFFTNINYGVRVLNTNGPRFYKKPEEDIFICAETDCVVIDLYFEPVPVQSVYLTLLDPETGEALDPEAYAGDFAFYNAETWEYYNSFWGPCNMVFDNIPRGNVRLVINSLHYYGNPYNKYNIPYEYIIEVGETDAYANITLPHRESGIMTLGVYEIIDNCASNINARDAYEMKFSLYSLDDEGNRTLYRDNIMLSGYNEEVWTDGIPFGKYIAKLDYITKLNGEDDNPNYVPRCTEMEYNITLDNPKVDARFEVSEEGTNLTIRVVDNRDYTLLDPSIYEISTTVTDAESNVLSTQIGNPVIHPDLPLGNCYININHIRPLFEGYTEYEVTGGWVVEMDGGNRTQDLGVSPLDNAGSDGEPILTTLSVCARVVDGSGDLPEDFSYSFTVENTNWTDIGVDFFSNGAAFSDLPDEFVVGNTYIVTMNSCDDRYEIISTNPVEITIGESGNEACFNLQLKPAPDVATASYGLGEAMALYNASLSANTVYGLKGYNQAPIPEGSLSCVTSIHSYGAPLIQLKEGYADLLGDLSTDDSTILYGFKADLVRDKIKILNQDTGVFETIDSDIAIYAINVEALDFNSITASAYRDDNDNVYFKSLIDTGADHFSPEIPSFVLETGINMLYTTVEL